jgi:N utilization substance protein B
MRRTDQRRAAIFALYQADLTGRPLDDLLPREATAFSRELVAGVDGEREQLDALIERHATGWTLDRIAPLERSILRVALYELLHRSDIPAEVAIDEAVETAKELCGADAPGFVNGILGAVQREQVAAK